MFICEVILRGSSGEIPSKAGIEVWVRREEREERGEKGGEGGEGGEGEYV